MSTHFMNGCFVSPPDNVTSYQYGCEMTRRRLFDATDFCRDPQALPPCSSFATPNRFSRPRHERACVLIVPPTVPPKTAHLFVDA